MSDKHVWRVRTRIQTKSFFIYSMIFVLSLWYLSIIATQPWIISVLSLVVNHLKFEIHLHTVKHVQFLPYRYICQIYWKANPLCTAWHVCQTAFVKQRLSNSVRQTVFVKHICQTIWPCKMPFSEFCNENSVAFAKESILGTFTIIVQDSMNFWLEYWLFYKTHSTCIFYLLFYILTER